MPGERHSDESTIWRTRLLRWTVLGIGWTLYLLCRGCVIGQIKYDPPQGRLIIRARRVLTKRIALLVKIFVLSSQYLTFVYVIMAIGPFLWGHDEKRAGSQMYAWVVSFVGIFLAYWNIGRLVYWLNSLGYNRSIVRVVNEVIRLHGLIDRSFGPLLLAELHIPIVFIAELNLTVLQLLNCLRVKMILFLYNIVLLQVFFSAYVAYQMLLISWLTSFSLFLHRYQMQTTSSRGQCIKLLRLFRLYARVSNGHQAIMVLWLPVASMLFSSIVLMVADCASIIQCILYKHNLDMRQKWDEVLGYLGGSLAPLLRMLLIGLCNESLARLEKLLSLQLLGIDLRHQDYKMDPEQLSFARQVRNLQICFDLQTRAQPIRNHIMSLGQICGGPFFLEFLFCTLINSFSCVQYAVSSGTASHIFEY